MLCRKIAEELESIETLLSDFLECFGDLAKFREA